MGISECSKQIVLSPHRDRVRETEAKGGMKVLTFEPGVSQTRGPLAVRWTSSQAQGSESTPGATLRYYHRGVYMPYLKLQLVPHRFPSACFCISVLVFTQQI